MNNILLIEPQFPLTSKSKNHSTFLPIGLLKIASYHRAQGDHIELVRGNAPAAIPPDEIKVTSLFTYWSQHVHDSVRYYKELYPNAHVQVGGIYASLMPEHAASSGCDDVYGGLYMNGVAENYNPAYDLVDVDYQIIHASRGCFRRCNFCGTWRIERDVTYKQSITAEIQKPKLVFYDNNLLANPYIDGLLEEIADFRFPNKRMVTCESQSGLDGRLLIRNPEKATLLKKARFKNPRVAWDASYAQWPLIKEQIAILKGAGYNTADIYVFMLYNHDLSYAEMRQKLDACRRWGVRVIDCRFRPLDSTTDGYNPHKKRQDEEEYYIHTEWTDWRVRHFRRAVRRQNIAIMLKLPNGRYIEGVERGYVPTA